MCDGFPVQEIQQTFTSEAQIIGNQTQAGTTGQSTPDLGHRGIETQRGKLGNTTFGGHVIGFHLGGDKVAEAAMFYLHPLGLAGRSRCVNHVGQIGRLDPR